MASEVYSSALKNALNEIQNICPQIKKSFIFREDGEIIAGDKKTSKKTMIRVINAFHGILEKAQAIGDVEDVTIKGNKGRVDISCMNNLYLVTVTSRKADMKYVTTVTRVLIPTLLKRLEEIRSTPLKREGPPIQIEPEIPMAKESEESIEETAEETVIEESKETLEPEVESEPLPPETPVNQFVVENLDGFLVPSDTVRINSETLSKWEEMYKGRRIGEVEIETFAGKTTRCKVNPVRDSNYYGGGIIRIPEKLQRMLEIKKGELVRVKPVVA